MKAAAGVLLVFAVLASARPGLAARVDGLPRQVAVGGQELLLAGCTVREILWADLYSLALYVPANMPSVASLNDSGWPKAVRLQVLWNGRMPEAFPAAWRETFDRRAPQLVADMEAVYAMLRPGDHVWVSYVPGSGSLIHVNGVEALHRKGFEPMESLLYIWARENVLPDFPGDVTKPNGC